MNIGKSIRVAMAIHDVDNLTLAKGIQKHVSNVNAWRRGESISTKNIELLAEFFHMSASEFIALGEDK